MWARLESNTIVEILRRPKALNIGGTQYPQNIFSMWTEAELAVIGIVPVTIDNTNFKNKEYYINTDITYAYSTETGKATGSYGTATAKAIADTLYTAQDETDGKGIEGEVATRGLKYNLIQTLKSQVANELAKTDWYITRNTEKSTAIPSAISTHRNAVRTKQAEMETAITNASDTPALETLYTYTKQEDGSVTRPLGELPRLDS